MLNLEVDFLKRRVFFNVLPKRNSPNLNIMKNLSSYLKILLRLYRVPRTFSEFFASEGHSNRRTDRTKAFFPGILSTACVIFDKLLSKLLLAENKPIGQRVLYRVSTRPRRDVCLLVLEEVFKVMIAKKNHWKSSETLLNRLTIR